VPLGDRSMITFAGGSVSIPRRILLILLPISLSHRRATQLASVWSAGHVITTSGGRCRSDFIYMTVQVIVPPCNQCHRRLPNLHHSSENLRAPKVYTEIQICCCRIFLFTRSLIGVVSACPSVRRLNVDPSWGRDCCCVSSIPQQRYLWSNHLHQSHRLSRWWHYFMPDPRRYATDGLSQNHPPTPSWHRHTANVAGMQK
jgi:hypothetical protein